MMVLLTGCAMVPDVEQKSAVEEWGSRAVDARAVYDEAIGYLAKGRQMNAEVLVANACEPYPDCRRLWFLRGVLERSRFKNNAARASFAKAYSPEDDTMLSQVAHVVVLMDMGLKIESGFEELRQMIDARPEEILVRWLFAMETSYHGLHVQEGENQFAVILKEWKVAPVMVHQSYATLLTTNLDNPKKALEHRRLAAELEPGGDTYQGLAYTLKRLKQYDEADQVYAKLLEMEPDKSIYWIQWGSCRFYMGDYAAAAEKFEKAYACDRSEITSLLFWGRCLEKQGQPEEGFAKYAKAVERDPKHPQAKAYAAHSKLYGYGTRADFEWALETCTEKGKTAIENLRYRVRLANESKNPLSPMQSQALLKHLTALGDHGDPDAQYSLGMIYRHGIGISKNIETADNWLRQAAQNGHEIAKRMMNPPF